LPRLFEKIRMFLLRLVDVDEGIRVAQEEDAVEKMA
jgi:hypothetical protein